MKIPYSLRDIQEKISRKEIKIEEVVRQYLSVIDDKNATLNAFLEVYQEDAIAKARKLDQEIVQNGPKKLSGLVVGIKDLFCYQGKVMSGASRILHNFESQVTATAIQKMEEEGAIIIGRQNCDEFGMGSSNENSAYGPVKNEIDTDFVPGGSSGGSAVAVQAGMCTVSLASDTGGSIRQPAAFTGTYGFKPTYGRISRYGLTAYASSFDCVGLIANHVSDLEQVLEVISGEDENDHTSAKAENFKAQTVTNEQPFTIVTFPELSEQDKIEPDILKTYRSLVRKISKDHSIVKKDFPFSEYLLPIYYILTSAEASANLSRYDGVRYGYRSDQAENIEELYKRTRYEGFGKEVIRRILLGTFVLSASYHDAFYVKAMKARRVIKSFMKEIFKTTDIIILPTTPTTAFKLGAKTGDPIEMYLSDVYTTLASIGGFPAISIPYGENQQGFPIGIQLIANEFEEAKLLKFSKTLTLG